MARTTDAPTQAAMNSAVGLMGQFDFEGAAAAFAKIARQEDAPPEALLNQALAIMNQSREGAQDEAMALLRAFQATEPSKALAERARYAEALCALYMGRASEAAPLLEAIARNRSSDGYAQYFAAQALEQSDQTAAALEAFVRAAAADSNLKSAPLGIQRCARKLGDEARAERALAAFEILAANPRAHAAEFKYTRMGALALAVLPETAVPTVKPAATPGAPRGRCSVRPTRRIRRPLRRPDCWPMSSPITINVSTSRCRSSSSGSRLGPTTLRPGPIFRRA